MERKANMVPDVISQCEDLKDNIPLDQDHNSWVVLSLSQFLSGIIEISAFTSLDQEIMEAHTSPEFQSELNKMLQLSPKTDIVNNQGFLYVKGALVVPKGEF
ncbi:hypothetical protein DSO57_1021686 [Entomophthora muscae]|uniref:Uncharacterized protein n=1 Tax=Entomophthora muscae TaxID=34485 RepID=A0ACC2U1A0_9FUNG|nr:hypothetical protein DSO57_1021686 [Entomophthora muscae]